MLEDESDLDKRMSKGGGGGGWGWGGGVGGWKEGNGMEWMTNSRMEIP